jgi:predicted esterase
VAEAAAVEAVAPGEISPRRIDDDLKSVNQALAAVYDRCRIDRSRIGVGGFSDGATYALTLAVSNGDLFRAAIAFSPGGILAGEQRGLLRVFVSQGHATGPADRRTGDPVVQRLRAPGYPVTYRPFGGGHEGVGRDLRGRGSSTAEAAPPT